MSRTTIFSSENEITLTKGQDEAIQKILNFLIDPDSHVMVLAGEAGTGKTTMLKHLREAIPKQAAMMTMLTKDNRHDIKVYYTSTTHKAAAVLSEAVNEPATTIHNLMQFKVVRDYETGNQVVKASDKTPTLYRSLVIVDEAGMADSNLFHLIMDHTKFCKVLLVGDKYQLPPVNEEDALAFTEIPEQVHLTEVVRQAKDNPIIQFARQYRKAQDTLLLPVVKGLGNTVQHLDGDAFREEVDKAFTTIFHPDDVRILCWTNARVREYNQYIRKLNKLPADFQENEWVISNTVLMHQKRIAARPDQILQVKKIWWKTDPLEGWVVSFYGVVGEYFFPLRDADKQGYLQKYKQRALKTKDPHDKRYAWVEYYTQVDKFCDLRAAYASTINKSQGSTYRKVFIDLNDIKRSWDKKHIARLLYTAATRASDKLYLYGGT